jgi:hypothetical protein
MSESAGNCYFRNRGDVIAKLIEMIHQQLISIFDQLVAELPDQWRDRIDAHTLRPDPASRFSSMLNPCIQLTSLPVFKSHILFCLVSGRTALLIIFECITWSSHVWPRNITPSSSSAEE